ncbi:hypothetical protein [Nonomuraea sp. NPDC049141]|uniref:hypothetical protein n=1 Tax=Nonomuraea sp. NPDC049141 TaxID=3155500 RepID=UPI00340A464C
MPLSTTLSDAALFERSWRDPEDFALLFDGHAGHIHRYVARRLGDDTADDVVSEFGVDRGAAYDVLCRGELPMLRIGRKIRSPTASDRRPRGHTR